jgi:hypothetical protein
MSHPPLLIRRPRGISLIIRNVRDAGKGRAALRQRAEVTAAATGLHLALTLACLIECVL